MERKRETSTEKILKLYVTQPTTQNQNQTEQLILQPKDSVLSEAKKEAERQGTLILMKEWVDGYEMDENILAVTDPAIVKLVGKEKLTLAKTITLPHPFADIDEKYKNQTVIIPNNYTAAIRYGIFKELAKQTAIRTGRQFNEDTPLLFPWQYDVIKKKGKITYFTNTRRSGKSVLLTLFALEGCMRKTHASSIRPTTVLYIGLSFGAMQPVFNYLLKMKEALGAQGDELFHREQTSSKYVFSFRQNKKVVGQIIFLSCESKNPGIGYFADLIIIDEAALVPREVFEGLEPIVTHEGAELICASTMYKNVRKSRFYERLIEYEKTALDPMYSTHIDETIVKRYEEKQKNPSFRPDHCIGLRYTIDELNATPEKEKEAIKKLYESDPIRYMTELYSRFPDEGKIFKYEACTIPEEKVKQKVYEYVSVGFDPALTADKSAVVVAGYSHVHKKITIIDEFVINKQNKGDYASQIPVISSILEQVKAAYSINNTAFITIDGTQKATAELFQYGGIPINLRVVYKDGINITQTNIYNELKVPKRYLVEICQALFDNGKIRVNERLSGLRKELDNFYELGEGKKFGGVGEHDDLVNAMMLAVFYLYEMLNVKYDINVLQTQKKDVSGLVTLQDISEYRNQINMIKENERIAIDNRDYRLNNVW